MLDNVFDVNKTAYLDMTIFRLPFQGTFQVFYVH